MAIIITERKMMNICTYCGGKEHEIRNNNVVKEKECRTCGRTLPADCFGAHYRTKDGLFPDCRVCVGNRASKKRRENNIKKRTSTDQHPISDEKTVNKEQNGSTENEYYDNGKIYTYQPNLLDLETDNLFNVDNNTKGLASEHMAFGLLLDLGFDVTFINKPNPTYEWDIRATHKFNPGIVYKIDVTSTFEEFRKKVSSIKNKTPVKGENTSTHILLVNSIYPDGRINPEIGFNIVPIKFMNGGK